jgi:tetratricopeptide (TPR) repeat protein
MSPVGVSAVGMSPVGTSTVWQRLLPWLLVLPALLFATPLSPLDADPYPHLTGTAFDLLLLGPLALVLLFRGANTVRAWPFVGALAWALVSWKLGGGTDALEARRALGVLALLPLALVGGSALDARGREILAALLVGLSLVWTSVALVRGFTDGAFAGVLGDTGSLSQAALPGAAIGALWLARGTGARRFLGALALAVFLGHVAAAPVVAGAHTLLAALLLAALRGGARGRGFFLGLALVALVAPFAGQAAREAWNRATPAGAPSDPSHSLGGLAVRVRVWHAALGLIGAQPWLGAGPGQFQAAFPPYRDPREIELSRHGVCSELDTEVEHAHNDWVLGFCELGLVGGALLALGLLLSTRDVWRAAADDERLPLALAGAALLVNACVHAPLSGNPAASPLALAVLGALAPAGAPSRRRAILACLPALLALPIAPALITHGAAMSAYASSARRIDELARGEASRDTRSAVAAELQGELARARAVLLVATTAEPDSAPALALAARLAEGGDRIAPWDRLLALRPHSTEAWEESGVLCARAGRVADARERLAHALALSPTHPRILRNLARLELVQGELEAGLALLARLKQEGCLATDWRTGLGAELVLELGEPQRGALVLLDQTLASLSPEDLHGRARAAEDAALSGALECLAQLLWARQHAAAGDFEVALRNYRQAAQRSEARRGSANGPAKLYALELAAAELRAGHEDEAREHLRRAGTAQGVALEPWAAEALRALAPEGSR